MPVTSTVSSGLCTRVDWIVDWSGLDHRLEGASQRGKWLE